MNGNILWMWLGQLGFFSIGAIFIGRLVRTITTHILSYDIEKYKTRLKAESDREIERLKDDIKRAAFIRETRFNFLHAKFVGAFEDVYAHFFEFHDAAVSFLPFAGEGGLEMEDKYKNVERTLKEFRNSYVKNRVFFPRKVIAVIDDIFRSLVETKLFSPVMELQKEGVRDPEIPNHWLRARDAIEKIRPHFDKLHDEMQTLLGFDAYEDVSDKIEHPSTFIGRRQWINRRSGSPKAIKNSRLRSILPVFLIRPRFSLGTFVGNVYEGIDASSSNAKAAP